jgi:hypothetical protein
MMIEFQVSTGGWDYFRRMGLDEFEGLGDDRLDFMDLVYREGIYRIVHAESECEPFVNSLVKPLFRIRRIQLTPSMRDEDLTYDD